MDFWYMIIGDNWLLASASYLLITFLTILVWSRCYTALYGRLSATGHTWDDSLVYAINTPLKMLILLYGISYTIHILSDNLIALEMFDSWFNPIQLLGMNVFVLWFLLRFINKVESAIVNKAKTSFDKTTVKAISQLCSVVVTILVVLNIINPIFGVPISALLTFGGIGGIAVALACQDLLGNIFGGFYLYLDRPFNIGDKVYSPDKDIEGVIENIGWRLTSIRTSENTLKYIPNSLFSKIIIGNKSR